MRILITTLLLCISAVLFAQVPASFQGTLNIYQSSGTSPNYEIRGVFNDTQGRYTADSADVGDKIFILDGANCVELEITSIISTTGGILRCNVTDVDAVLVNPPLATGAIMEPTPNYGFPTFVDGISNDLLACIRTHFTLLVDNISSGGGGGITGVPGNTQDTVVQTGHGLSLLDPVFVNTSGNWILSNISDEDSCHMAIVTEVISADTLIITYNGLTTQPGHGYTVGSVYFVQDDGTYATTVPTNFINDIAFYVVSDSTLYITEQRPISPMTDLNGIYSSSDTIPDGTIATGDEFTIRGKTNPNYEFKFWPGNDNIYIKSDSALLTFSSGEVVFRDYKDVPTGIEYNGSGYVTNALSLTTKEYVDSTVAAVPTDNIYVTDGITTDATRQVEVINTLQIVDTLTNEFGIKVVTPLFSEEVSLGRLDATTGTRAILSESKNNIELRGNATDPLKLAFLEETAQGTNFSVIRARDTLSSNTDFILPNSNGSYAQVLTTDGQGRTAWDYIDSGNIQDSTITTADLAFTPLQGSGTSGRIPRYTSANTLSDGVLRDDGTLLALGGATVSGYSFYDYSTGGWRLATGTTAQRPTGIVGGIRYNSQQNNIEYYTTTWEAPVKSSTSTGLFTAGSVLFADANGRAAQDNSNLFWDDANNRLGIGTTNPATALDVVNTTGDAGIFNTGYGTSVFPGIVGRHARGTSGAPSALQAGDYLIFLGGRGHDGTSFPNISQGSVSVIANQTFTASAKGTYMIFATTADGTTSGTEKMRITGVGRVGIGQTAPARLLHVEGEARITDLTTDTPTRIVGADADGDLGAVSEGYGINVTGGALEVDTTQIATQSDLAAISPTTLYTGDGTIATDRTVTIAPDYLFKIRATDTYSSSGYLNFGTLNVDERFGFDFYDVNGTSSGRINSYYDIGSTSKNQLTIENVNSTELGRILMTHDGSEEELLILNKNGADTTLIRMNSIGTTIQDDNIIYVNSPNTQFTGSGFDVLASTSAVFTTPATQFTGTLRFDTDGSTATSIVGQDASNKLTNVALGYGLDLTTGTLLVDSLEFATQYDLSLVSGTTNLTFSGASSPVTLNSSSGTDVTFTAGAGVGLTGTGTDLTIAATDASISNEGSLTVGAGGSNTSTIVSNTSGSTAVTISGGTGITVTEAGSTITVANSGDTNAADDITGTVASTQVVYGTGANTVASEAAFVWDATNDRLGIGVANPTARVEIEGAGTTSATYGLQVEDSSGANIVSVRDDRYVAFGATTGGSIVEMFTDASRKTYFDGFDIVMYNRGSGQNQFGFFGGNGSLASPTDVAAGENLGEIAWYGYYNTADRYANVIRSKVDSVAGSTVWGRLEFNYGSSTPMVTMYGKNNLTQVHGRLGVTSRTGTATSIAGWSSGISTDVSVGYGLNLTSGALEVDTTLIGDGGGETNTASNLGAGAGVYEQKVSLDLQFNSLKSESTSQLTIAEDDPNNTIDFTINTGAVADAAATLTTGDQVYDFVTGQGYLTAEVDDNVSNEGSLSVGAGTANTSIINSNTSGSTGVTIEGGTNVTVTESGNTITIAATGGGATDLTFTGASSPYTLNSSTGTDVTFSEGEGISITRATNDLSIAADVMVGANGVSSGTAGIVPTPAAADNIDFLRGDGTWSPVEYTKNATIENPGSSENVTLFYTRRAITIREVADVVRGTSPSVTWQIKYATTRDSGSPTDLFSASRTTTSTSGATTTTFNDATIGAGNWIWLVTSATSGTNDELSVTLTYTID